MSVSKSLFTNSSPVILGAILNSMAVAESGDYGQYAIRAIIGGLLWIVFKVISDLIALKMQRFFEKKHNDPEIENPDKKLN